MLATYCILLACVSFLPYTAYVTSINTYALIMDAHAVAYTGPDDTYHQVTALPTGSQVKILAKTDTWSKIAWRKQIGWIHNTMIEII